MSSSLTPRSIHSYFGEPNPLYKAPSIVETCSAKQLEAIKQLKTKCEAWIPELAPEEKAFMTNEGDLLYFRYLAGYGWEKLKDAEEGLKQTCKWRAETKPQNLKFEDLGDVGKSGFVFHYGYDKMNRPIVYIDMKKDTTPMTKENIHLKYMTFVYYTEQLIKRMPENVYQISWILDVSGANVSLSLVKQMKDTFLALGIYYCERLSLAFVCNVTMTMNMIWKFVSTILAKQTVERYHVFKKDCKKFKDAIHHFFDEDRLLKGFHGTVDFELDLEMQKAFDTVGSITELEIKEATQDGTD